jgi:molecular chaperone DnaK (HSP70)
MSVVGIDLGTLNTVIAVARNRGVDVVCVFLWNSLVRAPKN